MNHFEFEGLSFRLAAEIKALAIQQNLVPYKTGRLQRSLLVLQRPDGSAVITSREQYAYYVHNGRGPVVPRRKKALSFKINGKKVIVKRVGPAKAQPFLVEAQNILIDSGRAEEIVKIDVEERLEAYLRENAGKLGAKFNGQK